MARPGSVLGRSLFGMGAIAVGALAWGVLVERGNYRLRI